MGYSLPFEQLLYTIISKGRMAMSINKISYSIVIFTLFLCISFNVRAEDRYINKDKGFSIEFPKDWTIKDKIIGDIVVQGIGPKVDNFPPVIGISSKELPSAVTLDMYFKDSTEAWVRTNGAETGSATINNVDSKWIIFTYTKGKRSATEMKYYIVKNGRGYTIICAAIPSQFPQYKSEFERIVKTFKFE